jgi:hypothetical protein
MPSAAHYALAALGLLALGACGSDGTTASCRTTTGEELPRYNVNDIDDGGSHPDAQVNAKIEQSRTDLVPHCLTAFGNPDLPTDSGSDAGSD